MSFHDMQSTTAKQNTMHSRRKINRKQEFIRAIVWSPLPPITWIFPFIGHMGIADSSGVASDFQGPYHVGDRGFLAFGAATRYLPLKLNVIDMEGSNGENDNDLSNIRYDESIKKSNEVYRGRMHNLFCDNCHSHVAYALNDFGYEHDFSILGPLKFTVKKWDMVKLCFWVFFEGTFVDTGAIISQFGPFLILIAVVIGSTMLMK